MAMHKWQLPKKCQKSHEEDFNKDFSMKNSASSVIRIMQPLDLYFSVTVIWRLNFTSFRVNPRLGPFK